MLFIWLPLILTKVVAIAKDEADPLDTLFAFVLLFVISEVAFVAGADGNEDFDDFTIPIGRLAVAAICLQLATAGGNGSVGSLGSNPVNG